MRTEIEFAIEKNIVKSINNLGLFELMLVIISGGLILLNYQTFWFINHLILGAVQVFGTFIYLNKFNCFKSWVKYYKIYLVLVVVLMIIPILGMLFLFVSSFLVAIALALSKIAFNEGKLNSN